MDAARCAWFRWSNHHFKSSDTLWYGLDIVRLFPIPLLAIAACGGYGQIQNLPLAWRGVAGTPQPSAAVAQSFAASPIAFGLRDVRPDPSVVGSFEDGFVVRTTDNVAEYCSTRVGELLAHAGARLNEPPRAVLEAELLEYHVAEGGTFAGLVRIRAIVRHGSGEPWTRTYVGKSTRWGRTHNPENFNEALSNALAEVTQQLVQDEAFARALVEGSAAEPLQPPPLPSPAPSRG